MDKNLNDLLAKRKSLKIQLSKTGDFIKGSIMEYRVKCGKPICRCKSEGGHLAYYLSIRHKNKTKNVYIPFDLLDKARLQSKNYVKIKELVEELSLLNVDILKSKPRG
jgi:hypothetical protein